jgi:hypothetical protein
VALGSTLTDVASLEAAVQGTEVRRSMAPGNVGWLRYRGYPYGALSSTCVDTGCARIYDQQTYELATGYQ